MAYTRLKTAKNGRKYYEIQVYRADHDGRVTKRWYVPQGWSKRSIERALAKEAAEFEELVAAGEVSTRKERLEEAAKRAQEEAHIMTLERYAETVFMPAKAVTMSENSRSSYEQFFTKWINPALGELKMPDITAANISALLLHMQSQGKSHATCVKAYNILNGLFKMAYLTDVVERNPMDKVERPKLRKDEKHAPEVEAYTVEELRRILEGLKKEPLKWQALIRLLIDTGIRRGECCGLRWAFVDFESSTVTIAGNLCYTVQKGIYLDTPKSGKERTIDVDPDVMEMLRELREMQKAEGRESEFVFTQDGTTEPMHPQSPTRYMQKFSAKYGVPDMHPHKLRHTFASIAITHGADIASVSEKLGHSDKAITLRMYTHASMESIKRASKIFREALKG